MGESRRWWSKRAWLLALAGLALVSVPAHATLAEAPGALALGDFDGDGTEDLVVARDGSVEVRMGVLAADVPRWAGAKIAALEPFRAGARVAAPAADWAASGDFDNDGRLDVVLATRGARELAWMRGDGHGGLAAPTTIALAGTLGAFASGEVDRPDGLRDIVAAIAQDDGPAALVVFAGPRGAARAEARFHVLPWMPSELVIGAFDADAANDLALAGGNRIGVVQGRDPNFPHAGAGAPPLAFERTLGAPVRGLAAGDFVLDAEGLADLAAVDARGVLHTFASRTDGVLPQRRGRGTAALRFAHSRATLGSGPVGEDARLFAGRFDDRPAESLVLFHRERAYRVQAGVHAEAHHAAFPGTALIGGAIVRRGADARTSLLGLDREARLVAAKGLAVQLLTVNTVSDMDDGSCNAAHCSLREALAAANGSPSDTEVTIRFAISAGAAIPTIVPQQPLPAATRSLTIDGTTQAAGFVEISGAALAPLPGEADGLVFEGAATVVRGLVVNRFDGNFVTIRGNGSVVEGNRIGTTAAGTGNPDPNGSALAGLRVEGSGVRVGGTAGVTPSGACTGACNLIAGVPGTGLEGTVAADGLVVQGNRFGLAVDGTTFLPTRFNAMRLRAPSVVGGPSPAERNVFGAASFGISATTLVAFENSQSRTLFQGNYVGTDVSGTIAGGGYDGISNYGFDSTFGGTAGVTPGGPCTGACNLFSGNFDEGIELEGTGRRIVVQGSYFGLDRTGLLALPNATHGLEVRDDDNLIGGTVPEAANVFSGNPEYGIRIGTGGSNGPVRIVGNRIGTNAAGDASIPNGLGGVIVGDGTHVVGGPGPGEANLIAGNGGAGIAVWADADFPARVFARDNELRDNLGLGIDLGDTGDDGVTPNDADDSDAARPNFPEFVASVTDSATNLTGTIERPAAQAATLDVYRVASCDTSGNGEGEAHVGSIELPAGAAGPAAFSAALPPVPAGTLLTATSTLAQDGTSEFSACVTATAETPVDLALGMSVDPVRARAGGAVVYLVEVTHRGGPGVDGATLVVALPPGSTPGAVVGASCNATSSLLGCSTGAIGVGGTVTITVAASLPAAAQDGQVLIANASVESTVTDPNPADNADSAAVTIENDAIFRDGFE